jgi:RimJ/RimL family protein N-acetyltransferase
MTFHAGRAYTAGGVRIAAPPTDILAYIPAGSDVAEPAQRWSTNAAHSDQVYYFTIWQADGPIGQILLHDISWRGGTALIAYHLFAAEQRGQGIGTQALSLLQLFVREETRLRQCAIITSRDNVASQRVAVKCGFVLVGSSREDPENGLVFQWGVARP